MAAGRRIAVYRIAILTRSEAQGELLVERPDGTVEEVYAGEVSVRGIYGYV